VTLQAGSRLGPYEILGPLGAGGMGEVWRARDTRLEREVALKVLPAALAADGERLQRFEREAKLLASLNHPHIAAIHGLEDSGEVKALVLELVEGPTLLERIAEGPLPLDETIVIGLQIAEALETAHEKGVIHRDLKPANVKLSFEGAVKVLDFGLAKALDPAASSSAPSASPTLMNSPTLTAASTKLGVILGTAAYMAPEQAKGKPVDRRADIWAFGAVLWECLTGQSPFAAETVAETIGYVMTRDLDPARLPPRTPAALRQLIARCLVRDPRHRLQAIGDARIVLEELGAHSQADESPGVRSARARAAWVLPWGITLLAILGLAWALSRGGAGRPVDRGARRAEIEVYRSSPPPASPSRRTARRSSPTTSPLAARTCDAARSTVSRCRTSREPNPPSIRSSLPMVRVWARSTRTKSA
jgi:eukaryotic-like serine/threonine-protein kinase